LLQLYWLGVGGDFERNPSIDNETLIRWEELGYGEAGKYDYEKTAVQYLCSKRTGFLGDSKDKKYNDWTELPFEKNLYLSNFYSPYLHSGYLRNVCKKYFVSKYWGGAIFECRKKYPRNGIDDWHELESEAWIKILKQKKKAVNPQKREAYQISSVYKHFNGALRLGAIRNEITAIIHPSQMNLGGIRQEGNEFLPSQLTDKDYITQNDFYENIIQNLPRVGGTSKTRKKKREKGCIWKLRKECEKECIKETRCENTIPFCPFSLAGFFYMLNVKQIHSYHLVRTKGKLHKVIKKDGTIEVKYKSGKVVSDKPDKMPFNWRIKTINGESVIVPMKIPVSYGYFPNLELYDKIKMERRFYIHKFMGSVQVNDFEDNFEDTFNVNLLKTHISLRPKYIRIKRKGAKTNRRLNDSLISGPLSMSPEVKEAFLKRWHEAQTHTLSDKQSESDKMAAFVSLWKRVHGNIPAFMKTWGIKKKRLYRKIF